MSVEVKKKDELFYSVKCHFVCFSAYLTDEQKLWFVNFFKQMCRVGLSEKYKTNNDKDMEKDSPTKDEVSSNRCRAKYLSSLSINGLQ